MRTYLALAAMVAVGLTSSGAEAQLGRDRNQVIIVGSSTVYPFTAMVIERFAGVSGGRPPVVQSTGTGGGIELFCAGPGLETPDITGASRPMRAAEFDECRRNNVIGITEVEFGKDGIVLANARQSEHFDVTLPQLFAALAAEVEVNGEVVPNPYTRWSDIDPALPDQEITVIGPPSTSGTRDALIELGMEPGCQAYSAIAALPPDRRDAVCTTIRRDAHFITAGEDDNEIVQMLAERPEAFGIFGYSFLEENLGILSGNPIAGVEPDYETIASGDYPLSRSLYLYVKNQHVGEIAGMRAFIAEYTSERAIGEEGYLVDAGLVALPSVERQQARDTAMSLVPMSRPGVDEAAAGTN